ncbi:DEAD/DEAH box helicase [Pseudactinotalea sp. HY158]|uniref:DEAD/DEAH box helicase n=1 Tax=Pseudactinotalea sp. HY158 TaxID=2654547 RepID=UPI00129C127D|nr:DEAD/DEAH box helicase [Pseudactinotalea sp. HY158]QGH70726.1 hypothetical protein GCE65_15410 [Pseudactinotalea sp. HY158]
MADPLPLIDVDAVRARVDRGSFDRGEQYAGQGAVAGLTWSSEHGVLTSVVLGNSAAPYRCRVDLERGDGAWSPAFMACSCPVGSACKHAVATMLSCHWRALESGPGPDSNAAGGEGAIADSWRGRLAGIGGAEARDRSPLALGFALRADRFASVRPVRELVAAGEALALTVRPLRRGKSGAWIKGNLTWRTLAHQIHRLSLDPDQLLWFSQLLGLYDATRTSYAGVDTEGLPLADFRSPLLWTLLADAEQLGIELVGLDRAVTVSVAAGAGAVVEWTALPGSHGGLRLEPRVGVEGRELATWSPIGDHGLWAARLEDRSVRVVLTPTATPFGAEQRRLVEAGALEIPPADVPEFYATYYPRLRSAMPVRSGDDAVTLPPIEPATLRLAAAFRSRNRVTLTWQWHYHDPPRLLPFEPEPGPAPGPAPGSALAGPRDRAREAELVAVAESLWPGGTGRATHELTDVSTAEFTTRILPALERQAGLEVEVLGRRPAFEELTGAPSVTVTTVETERTDWFDLGFLITVEGREIPFVRLFEALSRGRKKLLLVDRSYFSLEHPAFDQLRELLAEAEALPEWEPDRPRLSRYQVDLWADFEDLADETVEARSWRESVAGLRDLDSIEARPQPDSVRAVLRPYQLDGFRWLAFLWRHRLGGILADDMGLGKTLQTLSLIAHARTGGDAAAGGQVDPPFLVIAPTSVVSTWLNESARFTPQLHALAITATRGKRGTSLAQEVAGADLVVTSYAIARLDAEEFTAADWSGLVLDEAQFVKNPATRAHREIARIRAPFRLAITGTPLENSLTDLWALASLTAPGLFPSARRFREEYVRPIESGAMPERLDRLRRRLRPFMLRRAKEAVARELPPKQEQVIRVDLSARHRQLYDTTLQRERQKVLDLVEDLDRNRFIVFRSISLLRMLALAPELIAPEHAGLGSSKLDALAEVLPGIVAEGHRTLVFSQFTSFLRMAADRCEALGIDYVYLDGSTRSRPKVIEGFRSGAAPVFLISLKAGGFGLTLTEADYVFMLDPWWNPATEAQAVDRTHRIGQTKNVMVYRLVAEDTIEEKVMALQRRKAALFSAVMDSEEPFARALTAEDVRGLFD